MLEIIEQQAQAIVRAQRQAKATVMSLRHQQLVSKQSELTPHFPADLHRIDKRERCLFLAFSTFHGFSHHKGAFRIHCVCCMPRCQCTRFLGNHHQKGFFDVKVFNPTAPSYRNTAVYLPYTCS